MESVVLGASTPGVAPWCSSGAAATDHRQGWGGGEGQAPRGTPRSPAPGAFHLPLGQRQGQLFPAPVERPLAPSAVCLLSQEHLLSACCVQWAGSLACIAGDQGPRSCSQPAHTAPPVAVMSPRKSRRPPTPPFSSHPTRPPSRPPPQSVSTPVPASGSASGDPTLSIRRKACFTSCQVFEYQPEAAGKPGGSRKLGRVEGLAAWRGGQHLQSPGRGTGKVCSGPGTGVCTGRTPQDRAPCQAQSPHSASRTGAFFCLGFGHPRRLGADRHPVPPFSHLQNGQCLGG